MLRIRDKQECKATFNVLNAEMMPIKSKSKRPKPAGKVRIRKAGETVEPVLTHYLERDDAPVDIGSEIMVDGSTHRIDGINFGAKTIDLFCFRSQAKVTMTLQYVKAIIRTRKAGLADKIEEDDAHTKAARQFVAEWNIAELLGERIEEQKVALARMELLETAIHSQRNVPSVLPFAERNRIIDSFEDAVAEVERVNDIEVSADALDYLINNFVKEENKFDRDRVAESLKDGLTAEMKKYIKRSIELDGVHMLAELVK